MNRPLSLSLIAASALLATIATAAAQSSQEPRYVDVGRDFRQSNQVTMGSDLLTSEEKSHFTTLRKQAKTRAEKDRVEAEESALLNQRVSERINAALNQPLTPGKQRESGTAERPDVERSPGSSTMPRSSGGMGSGGMGSGGR